MSPEAAAEDETPLFVYSSLRSHRSGMAEALDASGARRTPASAMVLVGDSGSPTFTDVGNSVVHGEAVYLPSSTTKILERLDAFESGTGYERVLVHIDVAGRRTPAWAYQLVVRAGEPMKRAEMLTAACRKLLIAQFHSRELAHYRGWVPADVFDAVPVPVQAHFEGILTALFAAADKVAGFYGFRDARGLFREHDEALGVPHDLREWYSAPLVAHARRIRNDATHNYYGKTPEGDKLHAPQHPDLWHDAPVDLIEYAAAVVRHLEELGSMIACPVPTLGPR